MKNHTMKKIIIAAAAGTLLMAGGMVQAKEGGDQYPNGAENWYAGAVPPPGNYFISYFGNVTGKYKDNKGHTQNPEVDATFASFRFLQSTNTQVLGGNYAWHVIVPVVDQHMNSGGWANKTGLGDVSVANLIAWHGERWHQVAALEVFLPTGAYDEHDARKSIGTNYYAFEPIYAVTYLGPNGWEVSGKFMYNIKTKNTDTDYRSGDEFHMDYLVGKHIGNWGLGISGYYLKQTTDDKLDGNKQYGKRGQVFAYGPSVKYSTKGGTHFIAQWQHETEVENRFGGDKVWLKMILPM